MLQPPTFSDIEAAREVVYRHLPRTPLYRYGALSERLGFEAYVKHENHLPVGAFKVRGGVNLVSRLSEEDRRRGLITASTGNHGQSLAFAGERYGVAVRICVPERCNPVKAGAMRSLGATLIEQGRDFEEARLNCERLAHEHGYRYVHSGDEPDLIAGVGTYALEIFEDLPDVDAIVVPIGGGSGAAGCCLVAKTLRPATEVIGVQSEAAPAAYLSWKHGKPMSAECGTAAEGLSTGAPFALPQRILRAHLDDFVLVSEDELTRAIVVCLEDTRNLAEGAGGAAIAAAFGLRDRLAGKRVALVLSGGNLSLDQLRHALAHHDGATAR